MIGTVLVTTAVGIGLGVVAFLEVEQAKARKAARKLRGSGEPLPLPPSPDYDDLPPVDDLPDLDEDDVRGPFVGGGWFDWPRKDVFADEMSFSMALTTLGYTEQPGTCMLAERFQVVGCAAIVGAFQEDYNLVSQYADVIGYTWPGGPASLDETELIDAPTVQAMAAALSVVADLQTPWVQIVQAALDHFG